MSDDHPLEDGWQPHTPAGDSVLRDFVDSTVRYLTDVGRAVGASVIEDDDIAGAHHSGVFPFANMTVVRRSLSLADWTSAVDRCRRTYPAGIPFVMMSPFPTPDLRPLGFNLMGHPPFMTRAPGDPPTIPAPLGLVTTVVTETSELVEFEHTLISAYPAAPAGSLFAPGILHASNVTLWIARLDGVPVATAAAHHGGGVNGIEIVSCAPDVRGRGIGEAVTWVPTLVRPEVPAALIASDAGRPVYERMGYLALHRFTLWLCV